MNITWDQVFCRFTGQKYEGCKEKLKKTVPDITAFLGLEHQCQRWILCGCLEECGETVEKLLQELVQIRGAQKTQKVEDKQRIEQLEEQLEGMQENYSKVLQELQENHSKVLQELREVREQQQQQQQPPKRKKRRQTGMFWISYEKCKMSISTTSIRNVEILRNRIQNGEIILGVKADSCRLHLDGVELEGLTGDYDTSFENAAMIILEGEISAKYEEQSSMLCRFYHFDKISPDFFDVRVPRAEGYKYTSKDVMLIKEKKCNNIGHYRLLISGVYYFVYHTAIPASGLTRFEITTAPSEIDFSQVPIDQIPSPKLKFGCMVVDEDLIKNCLEDMNTDSMQSLIKSAVVIPNSELPELFINRSFHEQLKNYFSTLEHGRVYTQKAPFLQQDPHNDYHKSQPDLVFLFDQKVLVVAAADEEPDLEEDNELSDEVHEPNEYILSAQIGCGEPKIPTRNSRPQLYGESFNVACSYLISLIRRKKFDMQKCTSISVYCLLLTNECRCGTISKMNINLADRCCEIQEDSVERSTDESLQILVSLLKQK